MSLHTSKYQDSLVALCGRETALQRGSSLCDHRATTRRQRPSYIVDKAHVVVLLLARGNCCSAGPSIRSGCDARALCRLLLPVLRKS